MRQQTTMERRKRREWIGGLVVLLCLAGVMMTRGEGPRSIQAQPIVAPTFGVQDDETRRSIEQDIARNDDEPDESHRTIR